MEITSEQAPAAATPEPILNLAIPRPVSCVSQLSPSSLLVGSGDGSLRIYDLSNGRVCKAIRGMKDEVSSVRCLKSKGFNSEVAWVASGTSIACFRLDDPKMILSLDDAQAQLQLGEDEDDLVNELALSRNGAYLAFGTDAGTVGVVDLSTQRVSRMKVRHENICGSVSFIPDRPNELISGGYDSAVLHHDFVQRSLLSRFDIAATPPSSGVSLSPPFILSISLSTNGLVAVGTADGRVWIGAGGEKTPSAGKKKRSRKWEGLKEDEGLWINVTEGPVVAVTFVDPCSLMTCTLLGTLVMYSLTRQEERLVATRQWERESKGLFKANTMSVDQNHTVVGGFDKDGKGLFHVWTTKYAALAVT